MLHSWYWVSSDGWWLLVFFFSLGGLFSKTEMSEVLTEIVKADPTFDKDSFLKQCEKDIIPNILEVNGLLVQLLLLSQPL